MSDEGNYFRSNDESLSSFLVHYQVQISLSVSGLLVLEAHMDLRQHVKTGREEEDLSRGNWELSSFGSAWLPNDTYNISSSKFRVNFSETLETFMVVDVAHNLKFLSVAFQVIENQIFPLSPDVGNSCTDWCLFLDKFALLTQWFILLDELWNAKFNVEFVRIRVGLWWFFKFIDHFRSVLIILGRIKNDLFFLLALLLGCFLLVLFLCLLGGHSSLFFKSLLLILTQLFLSISSNLPFLSLSFFVLNLLLRLLLS